MNDEELVEVIARRLHLYDGGEGEDAWRALVEVDQGAYREDAQSLLAALRSAGFQVYRPEDCERLDVKETQGGYGKKRVIDADLRDDPFAIAFVDMDRDVSTDLPVGTYHLVPADSGGFR